MEYYSINMEKTGQKIRELRIQKAITAEHLAEIMGITSQAVFRWQNGKAMPSLDNMLLLASIFDVKVEDIVVRNEPKKETAQQHDYELEL